MNLYRAEALTDALQAGEPQVARTTRRLPSNVPYVVDNLWEYLRPADRPSRRHALYASPTRELARRNRSGLDQGRGFCVYRLEVEGPVRVAHLRVNDAREHADVRAVMGEVQSFADEIAGAVEDEKPLLSLLFVPAATPADWRRAAEASPIARRLVDALVALSTFWADASPVPDPACDGELFLQLMPGARCRPLDLEPYTDD